MSGCLIHGSTRVFNSFFLNAEYGRHFLRRSLMQPGIPSRDVRSFTHRPLSVSILRTGVSLRAQIYILIIHLFFGFVNT